MSFDRELLKFKPLKVKGRDQREMKGGDKMANVEFMLGTVVMDGLQSINFTAILY